MIFMLFEFLRRVEICPCNRNLVAIKLLYLDFNTTSGDLRMFKQHKLNTIAGQR